jgi:hypothetical protein
MNLGTPVLFIAHPFEHVTEGNGLGAWSVKPLVDVDYYVQIG